MKIAICFLTFVIGYASTCSDTTQCDSTVTMCGTGYTLTCVQMSCVCVANSGQGAHTCQVADDCHNQNHHCAQHHHWDCVNSHCHCVRSGNNHPGGK